MGSYVIPLGLWGAGVKVRSERVKNADDSRSRHRKSDIRVAIHPVCTEVHIPSSRQDTFLELRRGVRYAQLRHLCDE